MDFSKVESITISEGIVKKIESKGIVIWEEPEKLVNFTIDNISYTVAPGTTWYTFANEQGWNCYSEQDGVWDADYNYMVKKVGDSMGVTGGDVIESTKYTWSI